jgi:transposase
MTNTVPTAQYEASVCRSPSRARHGLQDAGGCVVLPSDSEAEAARRATILKPLLEYVHDPNARLRFHHLRLASGEAVYNSDSLARYLAAQHKVSRSTIWSWKRRFELAGSTALARKRRTDKNKSRWATANRELADLAALLFMSAAGQPSAHSVRVSFKYVCERAERMGVQSPSYEAVRAFLRNFEEASPSPLRAVRTPDARKKVTLHG